jgi:hypothetical protein
MEIIIVNTFLAFQIEGREEVTVEAINVAHSAKHHNKTLGTHLLSPIVCCQPAPYNSITE